MEPIADPPGGGHGPGFPSSFSTQFRPKAPPRGSALRILRCLQSAGRYDRPSCNSRKSDCQKRCPMTSIADPLAGPSVAETEVRAKGEAAEAKAASVAAPAITLPAAGERELRLD